MKEQIEAPLARWGRALPLLKRRPQGVFGSLIPKLQKAVAQEGYVVPTPIQEQCIPHLLEGRDLLGIAQTGTGKTAAFSLPLLQWLSENPSKRQKGTPRALLLAPTRELAAQIGESIETYGQFLKLRHTVVFGGVGQGKQVRDLGRGVDIIVATPGRLLDLMQQGFIRLSSIEIFVLDEVDRMLDMGFIPDIKRILARIPKERQTLFFSATMPPRIVALAKSMVKDPVRVTIEPEKPTLETIKQKVFFVGKGDKEALLTSILEDPKVSKALVFVQMKHVANRVASKLRSAGVHGDAIHGDKTQSARTRALDGFKQGRFRVLVATDVAARGLDVNDISHVINYDLPVEAETYVHRIGRTARAGADGDAISFCTASDRPYLWAIERLLGEPVPPVLEHEFHCDIACRAKKPPPRSFGGARDRRRSGVRSFGNMGGRRRR